MCVDAIRGCGGTSDVIVRASRAGSLARLTLLVDVVTRAGKDAISGIARSRIRVVCPQPAGSLSRRPIRVNIVTRRCRGAGGLPRLPGPSPKIAWSLIGIPVTRCIVSWVGIDAAGLARLVLPSPRGALGRRDRSGPGVVAHRSSQAVYGGVGTVARVVRPRIARDLGRRSVGVDVVPRGCWEARDLPGEVVPGAQAAWGLCHGSVHVHVVAHARVHAAGLAGLVLPGADGAWRRGRCPGPGVVPRWHVTAVNGGVGTVARVVRPRIARDLGRGPVHVHVVPSARVDAGRLTGHVVPGADGARGLCRGAVHVHVVSDAGVSAVGLASHVVPCAEAAGRLRRRSVCIDVITCTRIHAIGLPRLVLPGPSRALGRRVRAPEGGVLAGRGCFAGTPHYGPELARWAWQVEAGLLVGARGVPLDTGQPVVGRWVEGGRVGGGGGVLGAGVRTRSHQVHLRTEHGPEVARPR